jgi:hypothetical protein
MGEKALKCRSLIIKNMTLFIDYKRLSIFCNELR